MKPKGSSQMRRGFVFEGWTPDQFSLLAWAIRTRNELWLCAVYQHAKIRSFGVNLQLASLSLSNPCLAFVFATPQNPNVPRPLRLSDFKTPYSLNSFFLRSCCVGTCQNLHVYCRTINANIEFQYSKSNWISMSSIGVLYLMIHHAASYQNLYLGNKFCREIRFPVGSKFLPSFICGTIRWANKGQMIVVEEIGRISVLGLIVWSIQIRWLEITWLCFCLLV